jgi:transcription antitermination factor NusG
MVDVTRMAGACPPPEAESPAQNKVSTAAPIAESPNAEPSAWFALVIHQYKRERCEEMLARLGYEYFSPCVEVVRTWSDRRKCLTVPLFPGYIFCRFNPEKRLALLRIPGVLGVVGSAKHLHEVSANEIDAIRVAIRSDLLVEPCPFMAIGKKIKVKQGPLRGVEGVLVRSKTRSRLLLSVGILNRSVSVEVEETQLAGQD